MQGGTTEGSQHSTEPGSVDVQFDLEAHATEAVAAYREVFGLYEDFARSLFGILVRTLEAESITTHSVTSRAKELVSFRAKASRPSLTNPSQPRYTDPVSQITDKAGVRVITYFLDTVTAVSRVIEEQFDILERLDRSGTDTDRLGYQSVHYLVRFKADRATLPEYRRFRGLVAEVQVRTILQHSWAEIEHDIQYKSSDELPTNVRRRFQALAGLIEIADREFQAIQEDYNELQAEARDLVSAGRFAGVEITPDSVKSYLDGRYGPDGRVADYNYSFAARLLRNLAFVDIEDLDQAIGSYDDDVVSRALSGSRLGQISRFDHVLCVATGDTDFSYAPKTNSAVDWFFAVRGWRIARARARGIPIGSYRPKGAPAPA